MKEKILIALNDQVLADLIVQKLNQNQFRTDKVQNGQEALDRMKTFQPDLALIDINLSVLSGYEVLNTKSFDKDITKIPVIIVSNSGSPIQMRQIPSTPIIKGFIVKSHIEPDEILQKIEEAFGRNPAEAKAEPVKINNKKVLWVEDDKLLGTILSKKIEASGYKLFRANNGDNTLKILETDTPDIIILDILLPEMSGFDVLQKIKANEKLRKIPVIMLSNMSKQSDVEKAKLLGANRFIVKAAVSLDKIIREIENLVK